VPGQYVIHRAFRGARLLFIGGKGGVGKTTVAAALAVRLARAMPKRRVLLLSTDPAHSLGDVFAVPLGDEPSEVPHGPRNLRVREVNASRSLEKNRAALEAALAEVASASGSRDTSAGERATQLMDLAPPGIDELFGMLSVIDARSSRGVIVVDMAPTGHALRLLAIPKAVQAWVHALLRILLKYRSLARPGALARQLVDASRSIRELQTLLLDKDLARFIVVTRAEAVPRAETERLFRRLRRLKVSIPALVVNALTLSPRRCPVCQAAAQAESRELARFERSPGRPRDCAIIQTPLAAPPPRGVAALESWARNWIA
jgi:arsenite-transporting ATPase